MPTPKKPLHEINEGRFKRRLAFIYHDGDCWIWASTCIKKRYPNGDVRLYPVMPVRQADGSEKQTYARRFAWIMKYGFIMTGYDMVNVCGEEKCVKPDDKHNFPAVHGAWRLERGLLNQPQVIIGNKNLRKAVEENLANQGSACAFDQHDACQEKGCTCKCHL